jgi:F-type H+-transporting ATPase subunit a
MKKYYNLDPGATALQKNEEGEIINASRPWDFSITKNVAAMMLTIIVMLIFFFSLAGHHRKSKAAPKGFNNLMESLVLFVRDEIARPQIGDAKYKKFMPFLLTIFFFIWITNLLGLLPGAANVTGNIAVTVSLGLFTLVVIVANGNMDFWKHTVWMPGIPTFVKPILAVIEILGVFVIKPVALMIRLFANITAGHIIILSITITYIHSGKCGSCRNICSFCIIHNNTGIAGCIPTSVYFHNAVCPVHRDGGCGT